MLIGHQNAIIYKEIFPHIKGNKTWVGYKFGDMKFRVPAVPAFRTDLKQENRKIGIAVIPFTKRYFQTRSFKIFHRKFLSSYLVYELNMQRLFGKIAVFLSAFLFILADIFHRYLFFSEVFCNIVEKSIIL